MGCIIARRIAVLTSPLMAAEVLVNSPGKTFTEPLLLCLALAMMGISFAMRGERRRRGQIIALASLALLWVFSTHVTAAMLERSLLVDMPQADPPAIIAVLSGGYLPGATGELDQLSHGSLERTIVAVQWWRKRPSARLVMTGADPPGTRQRGRMVELMRDEAVRRGVPPELIAMEKEARVTREHAPYVARLQQISPDQPIGVVTSAVHMRRALLSFRPYFRSVVPYASYVDYTPPGVFNRILPSTRALMRSTAAMHEWIGLAWYALQDVVGARRDDLPARRAARLR
ncbi:MAG TPA: YdcF family protein [Thermoanaerobaculia bacterium]|nr:YdcF family protein [Thermoanaerobaculia bacterium]